MKRLLVIAGVALLVAFAGCGMTSPAADEAREGANGTPTTTQASGSNPQDDVPIGSMLPEGYSQQGIQNVSLAYQQHLSTLRNESFQVRYVENSPATNETIEVLTNGSVDQTRYHQWIGPENATPTREVYQNGDTRYVKEIQSNGSETVSTTTRPFTVPEGTTDDTELRQLLEDIEVHSPQAMHQGDTTYISYRVESVGNASVEGGHFMILPSGQLRIVFLQFDDTEMLYTSILNDSVTVQEPAWVETEDAD